MFGIQRYAYLPAPLILANLGNFGTIHYLKRQERRAKAKCKPRASVRDGVLEFSVRCLQDQRDVCPSESGLQV